MNKITVLHTQQNIKLICSYVKIHDTTIEAGKEFCEWIKIAQSKLQERENISLQLKCGEIEHIINEGINEFINEHKLYINNEP